MTYEYEYYIPLYGETADNAETETFLSIWEGMRDGRHEEADYKLTAEDICRNRFSNWDYTVPEFLVLRRAGDTKWFTLSLEVRTEPVFIAWFTKEKTGAAKGKS